MAASFVASTLTRVTREQNTRETLHVATHFIYFISLPFETTLENEIPESWIYVTTIGILLKGQFRYRYWKKKGTICDIKKIRLIFDSKLNIRSILRESLCIYIIQ